MTTQSSTAACSLLPELHHGLLSSVTQAKRKRVPATLDSFNCLKFPLNEVRWALNDLLDQGHISQSGEYYFPQNACSHTTFCLTLDIGTIGSIPSLDGLALAKRPPTDYSLGDREELVGSSSISSFARERTPTREANISSVYLGKFYFPSQLRRTCPGKTTEQNTAALCHRIKVWEEAGISLPTIKLMINEFCKHPQWFLGKPAWKVFLARRDQLLAIATRQTEAERMEEYWDEQLRKVQEAKAVKI